MDLQILVYVNRVKLVSGHLHMEAYVWIIPVLWALTGLGQGRHLKPQLVLIVHWGHGGHIFLPLSQCVILFARLEHMELLQGKHPRAMPARIARLEPMELELEKHLRAMLVLHVPPINTLINQGLLRVCRVRILVVH